jgi:hypothetical protein
MPGKTKKALSTLKSARVNGFDVRGIVMRGTSVISIGEKRLIKKSGRDNPSPIKGEKNETIS